MTNTEIDKSIKILMNEEDSELYKRIGLAVMGTKSVADSSASIHMLKGMAISTDGLSVAEHIDAVLEDKGKSSVESYKDLLKKAICSDKGVLGIINKVGDGVTGELVKAVIAVIIGSGGITGALIAVAFAILICREGLKIYCGV